MQIRLLNYGFYFALILIFMLASGPFDKIRILLALFFSGALCYLSFIFRWLSLDGMKAAIVMGTVTLGLGGWEFTLYLLLFFISSNIIGAILDAPDNPKELKLSERRTDEQVWANGFWFSFFLCLWFITDIEIFAIASIAGVAAATSDTWATLIGGYSNKKDVWLITNLKKVPSGTDGGISLNGTVSGLLGAIFIGLITLFFSYSYPIITAISIALGGFTGCLADSFFGSRYQFYKRKLNIFNLNIKPENNLVNWMAGAVGVLTCILSYQLLSYAMV